MPRTSTAEILGAFQIQAAVRTTSSYAGPGLDHGTTVSLHAPQWRQATAALAEHYWAEHGVDRNPTGEAYRWEAVLDERRRSLVAIVGTEPKSFQRRDRAADLWRPATPLRFDDQTWKRLTGRGRLGVVGVLHPDLLKATPGDWGLAIEYAAARSGPVARAFGDTDHGFITYRSANLQVRLT